MISFITLIPEERYRQLLEKQPDLLQRVPQQFVAHYLGITPFFLSQNRKRMAANCSKFTLVA